MTEAERLREQAERCMRLAHSAPDAEIAPSLRAFAAECLEKAQALESPEALERPEASEERPLQQQTQPVQQQQQIQPAKPSDQR
jgi:hypothetical protein